MPRQQNAKPKKGINRRKLMNSMVNIPSTNPDPYYRYKMPALEIRINPARVRTNNPRNEPIEIPASTQLQNLSSIARALNRPLEYLSRYLELELELRGIMEDRQRWFKLCDAGDLTELELIMTLDKFIRRFVLCSICQNPETALTILKTCVMKECGACGQRTRVDPFSKLTRYLLKNRNFAMGFQPAMMVDPTKCRFLNEGATQQPKGTVMTNTGGFKNGVKVATAAEMAAEDDDAEIEDEEEDDNDGQDWSIDTSPEAVAQRRQQELALITRVEKIMNSVLGDKGKDPYKVFEEFVTTPKASTATATATATADSDAGALPDKDEVLGKYYTLDLEKEGAIFILERLKKRQQEQGQEQEQDETQTENQVVVETEEPQEAKRRIVHRDDYDEMIQVLRDSLEREVVVKVTLQDSSSDSSSSSSSDDDDDDDDDESDEDEDSDNGRRPAKHT
ncbi:hypothetical protein BGZ65_005151 [Modicella reniformis]|uniref:Translation initiation factor IF2/IF5 domain-containing protein n=1 Tax=Modicella reniformis TaxID=1440133 RepID=A0A9P6IL29_9FUNG|nr:hypothetical protein BGZ65_005151 [Modicella reniformis]